MEKRGLVESSARSEKEIGATLGIQCEWVDRRVIIELSRSHLTLLKVISDGVVDIRR